MAIQTFKLDKSEDFWKGFSDGYSGGLESGVYIAVCIIRRHRYDGTTIEDMADLLEDIYKTIKEANYIKRNEENDNIGYTASDN